MDLSGNDDDTHDMSNAQAPTSVMGDDIMQTLASGELPNQLAGATAALQEQLLAITQEMSKLKSEIYSEQGGLAEKLGVLAQQAHALEPKGGPASSSADGARGLARRPAGNIRERARHVEPPASSQIGARRVEFAPGTLDPLPMRERGRVRAPPQTPGWTTYIIGFCFLCIGPLRPLLWDLFSTLRPMVSQAWGASEEEVPWYDQ